jgi:hypothetical protein
MFYCNQLILTPLNFACNFDVNFTSFILFSRKFIVVSVKIEDFRCNEVVKEYHAVTASTYIDIVAYGNDPCNCEFRSDGRIRAKMLRRNKYSCFNEFQVHGKHMDLHSCPEDEEGEGESGSEGHRDGYVLGGDRLFVAVTKEYFAFMGNSTHSGSIEGPVRYEWMMDDTYTLSSMRLKGRPKQCCCFIPG